MILSYIAASRYTGQMGDAGSDYAIKTAFLKGHTRRIPTLVRTPVFCAIQPKIIENNRPSLCKVHPGWQ